MAYNIGKTPNNCNSITVDVSSDNAVTNGTNLLAAYEAAKLLTPNGAALSANNRATVVLPPGRYDIGSGSSWIPNHASIDMVASSPGTAKVFGVRSIITGGGSLYHGIDWLPLSQAKSGTGWATEAEINDNDFFTYVMDDTETLSVIHLSAVPDSWKQNSLDFRIRLGGNIGGVGSYAFKDASNLIAAVYGSGVHTVGAEAFANVMITACDFPRLSNVGASAFYSSGGPTPRSFKYITTIGNGAFELCSAIGVFESLTTFGSSSAIWYNTFVEISDSIFPKLTSLGTGAPFQTSNATSATLSKVTSIPANCFSDNYFLASVTFPLVTTIGTNAFSYDNSLVLTSTSFPSLLTIGDNAFFNALNSYAITGSIFPLVTTIGDGAFESSGITSVNLPSVTGVGGNSFVNSGISSLSFSALGSVPSYAFGYCYALTSVVLPVVTTIADSAFNSSITGGNVYLACDAANIDLAAFANCSNFTIYFKPGTTGWTVGSGQELFSAVNVTVAEWTNWPNTP